ncbi:unnamed protein product [Polarella glacialis]|uniref:EF-hand domain-containing protein n=1 Tax=Polarella glacialis TaxID=89957 RepID=A0A813FUC5_POLGL|nr:unnamed protein product [Polarella glacialis]
MSKSPTKSPTKGEDPKQHSPPARVALGINGKRPKKGANKQLPEANIGKHKTGSLTDRMKDSVSRGIQNDETRLVAREVVSSLWFDCAIGCVIFLNAISIGVELTLQIEDKSTLVINIIESIFLVIYILELALRLYAFGPPCLKDPWVQCDIGLVFLGVLITWILDPIFEGKNAASAFGLLMILRMLRLLRLAKIARLFKRFREFWVFMRQCGHVAGTMIYVFLILFVVLYIFSCLAVELITKHKLNDEDEEFREHVQKYFRSLPIIMLTLLRFACLDNTSEVYTLLVEKDGWLVIFFVLLIVNVSLVFFHLRQGAIIFNSTMERSLEEEDNQKRDRMDNWSQLISDLKDMFLRMDDDKSGSLSIDEFENIHPNDMKILTAALGSASNPIRVFQSLDVDKSGEVSISESSFCLRLFYI